MTKKDQEVSGDQVSELVKRIQKKHEVDPTVVAMKAEVSMATIYAWKANGTSKRNLAKLQTLLDGDSLAADSAAGNPNNMVINLSISINVVNPSPEEIKKLGSAIEMLNAIKIQLTA